MLSQGAATALEGLPLNNFPVRNKYGNGRGHHGVVDTGLNVARVILKDCVFL